MTEEVYIYVTQLLNLVSKQKQAVAQTLNMDDSILVYGQGKSRLSHLVACLDEQIAVVVFRYGLGVRIPVPVHTMCYFCVGFGWDCFGFGFGCECFGFGCECFVLVFGILVVNVLVLVLV